MLFKLLIFGLVVSADYQCYYCNWCFEDIAVVFFIVILDNLFHLLAAGFLLDLDIAVEVAEVVGIADTVAGVVDIVAEVFDIVEVVVVSENNPLFL